MGAADPTYPLYPIASVLAAGMLLLVLLTSFIRQNWNLGVTFLCFWLFLENLTGTVNAIIWADNDEIKHYVYCDIGAYFQPLSDSETNALYTSITSANDNLHRQTHGNPPYHASAILDCQSSIRRTSRRISGTYIRYILPLLTDMPS